MGLFGKKVAPAPPPQPVARAPPPPSLQEVAFKMKFTGKQLARQATKVEQQVAGDERKSKEALQKGNIEGARIHAQNAIRNKNTALSYMKLQSQLESVASQVQSQHFRQQVTQELQGVTQSLDAALGTMDMEKISQVMEKFVGQSETLDMSTRYMDSAMSESTSMTTPQGEVDSLLSRIAAEHDIDVRDKLNVGSVPSGAMPNAHAAASQYQPAQNDDIESRFQSLSGPPPR